MLCRLATTGEATVGELARSVGLSQSAAERAESGTTLAIAYSRKGMNDRAIEQLRTVLAESPRYGPAAKLLGQMERLSGGK